jgi:hypothetical protein
MSFFTALSPAATSEIFAWLLTPSDLPDRGLGYFHVIHLNSIRRNSDLSLTAPRPFHKVIKRPTAVVAVLVGWLQIPASI